MKLKEFRVRKFRNVVDSGPVEVDPAVTCLVGKNEAGKSGLIEALYLFNPAYDEKFDVHEQYPRWLAARDRKAADLGEHAPIEVMLSLEEEDRQAVIDLLGEGVLQTDHITVSRRYNGGTVWTIGRDDKRALANVIERFPKPARDAVGKAASVEALRVALAELAPGPDGSGPSAEDIAAARQEMTDTTLAEKDVWEAIVEVLKARLPTFFRFTNYNTLPGRLDLREIGGGEKEGPGRSGNQAARALLELAGTDVSQLGNDDYEWRKGELEAVQIDLTRQVFEYWKQNPDLEVSIDVDKETVSSGAGKTAVARFLDIRLRDRRTGYSNNFSQRSSGFQWFFSFFAAFSEFENRESPIVLLDEPALTLHGKAQNDFLRFINERLAPTSTVLYTTHSPFMVETGRLERVRIVEDQGPPLGATVSDDVMGSDPDSLFPLQAALGYDIAQNLFVGPHNLVVEGTSDFIFFSVLSDQCRATGRTHLDERWRMLPAGGATNIPTFVALIGPQLEITVVADSDTKGIQRVNNMIEKKLLSQNRLIMANVATAGTSADVEDLFSEGDYLKLYNKTYGTSVKVADLPQGDRVVKRLEALKGGYVHGEVAEALLRNRADFSFTDTTLDRFETLFKAVNATL